MRRCSVCGRMLKSPESMKIGMGPVCYRKVHGSTQGTRRARKKKKEEGNEMKPQTGYVMPGQISIEEYLQEI